MPVKMKDRVANDKFDPSIHIGFRDMIALFNISTKTLQVVLDGGYIQKEKDGYYRLSAAVQGYSRYKSDHGTKKGATKEAAASRVQEARARQIEQSMAIEAKELISFSEHTAIVDLLIGGVSAELDGLPAQLTRDREQRTMFEAKVFDLKKRLAERWARMAQSADDDANDDDDDEAA